MCIRDRYRLLRDRAPDEVERLRLQLLRYEELMSRIGVNEEQVGTEYRVGRVLGSAAVNTLLLAVGLPFLTVGIVVNFVPYLLSWLVSRLAGPLPDRRASAAFLAAFVAFPLAWAAIGVAVGVRWGLPAGVGAAVV